MEAPFAAIDSMISGACMQALADAVVSRANGVPFLAMREREDEQVFERHAIAESISLRYRSADAPDIEPGERLTVNGEVFQVSGDPRRIDAQEFRAQIVKVP